MRLEDRARSAARGIRDAIPPTDGADRFHLRERRRVQVQRVGAAAVALVVLAGAAYLLGRAFDRERRTPAGPVTPSGVILYGHYLPATGRLHLFTARADGSAVRDLSVVATCAQWLPHRSGILISDDAATRARGVPLRPATIDPSGGHLHLLDRARNPDLNLGCGDASPDGARLVLEGFSDRRRALNGIYSVRASDGGDLLRLTHNPYGTADGYPQFSPDGADVVFMRTRPGVHPDGAGALFVVRADGSELRRITPWGDAFLGQSWSPDGRWILFQRPYGRLFVVHPDGTGLHEIPLRLPAGAGAVSPAWSPDGRWIVFSLDREGEADIAVVRADGSGLRVVTHAPGIETYPDWSD